MSTQVRSVTGAGASALLVGLLSVLFVLPSHAGDCPAGKAGANLLPGAASAPVGVTEMELSSIDLGKEAVNLPQRRLRFRHMEIAPGGIVPLHTHGDRPALLWDVKVRDGIAPPRLRVPGLDPTWSSHAPAGETLLATTPSEARS